MPALTGERQIGRGEAQVSGPVSPGESPLRAGRLEEAHALAKRALGHAHTYQEGGRESPERAQAEAHYRQALSVAEALGMHPLQAHCHGGLGRLYATTGQQEPAHAEFSTAMAICRDMDMTFWLPATEAALAQVEM